MRIVKTSARAGRPSPKNALMRGIARLAEQCPTPELELMIRFGNVRVACFSEAAKLGGSHKLHLVLAHLYDGAESGSLGPAGTVVIPSSGSTAITTAEVCKRLGLGCIAVVPAGTSTAKLKVLARAGAGVDVASTLRACRERAAMISEQPGHFLLDQFAPAPTGLSIRTMAELHFAAVKAKFGKLPDETVVTFGTGTTALSFRREVTRHGLPVRIVDAAIAGGVSSTFYREGNRAAHADVAHKVEGINTGFVPDSARQKAVDGSIEIHPAAAFATCLEAGLDCGPSSGLAIYGALVRAQERQAAGAGGLLSVAIYDRASRYPETLQNPEYLESLGPVLPAYRRHVRILVRSEIWMSLEACGWHGEPAAPANDTAAAPPTMWPAA